MTYEQQPADAPEPTEHASAQKPAEPSVVGAKLFVIFFFAIVPLLGFALLAMVIYSLVMR